MCQVDVGAECADGFVEGMVGQVDGEAECQGGYSCCYSPELCVEIIEYDC